MKGYSKNYTDKERLYGFALWVKRAKLNPTAKNIKALELILQHVNAALIDTRAKATKRG